MTGARRRLSPICICLEDIATVMMRFKVIGALFQGVSCTNGFVLCLLM